MAKQNFSFIWCQILTSVTKVTVSSFNTLFGIHSSVWTWTITLVWVLLIKVVTAVISLKCSLFARHFLNTLSSNMPSPFLRETFNRHIFTYVKHNLQPADSASVTRWSWQEILRCGYSSFHFGLCGFAATRDSQLFYLLTKRLLHYWATLIWLHENLFSSFVLFLCLTACSAASLFGE